MYRTALLALLALMVSAGCTSRRPLSILAVDCHSGNVLTEATAQRVEALWQPAAPGLHWVRFGWPREAPVQADGVDGVLHLPKVAWDDRVRIQCAGYEPVQIDYPWLAPLNAWALPASPTEPHMQDDRLVVPLTPQQNSHSSAQAQGPEPTIPSITLPEPMPPPP